MEENSLDTTLEETTENKEVATEATPEVATEVTDTIPEKLLNEDENIKSSKVNDNLEKNNLDDEKKKEELPDNVRRYYISRRKPFMTYVTNIVSSVKYFPEVDRVEIVGRTISISSVCSIAYAVVDHWLPDWEIADYEIFPVSPYSNISSSVNKNKAYYYKKMIKLKIVLRKKK